jgi:hypothetical protein
MTAFLALALGLLQSDSASAHGGVSFEKDMCVMKIGPYKMHFTGYEPETKQSQEFCEDIPDSGKAIIVLDEVDKVLKRMELDFRIVRDDKQLGVNAQYEQLGGPQAIESSSIFYKKPEVYPHGTVTFDLNFDKGNYIGVVTLNDPETKQNFISVFPFSVGFGPARQTRNLIIEVIGALVLGGGILYFTNRRPKKKPSPAPQKVT